MYKTCYRSLFKIGFLFYHFIVRSVQHFIYLPEKTKAKKHSICYKNCSQGGENSNFQRFPVLFTSGESAYNKIMLPALCTSIFHELKNFRTQRSYTKKSFLPAGNKKVFEFLVLSQWTWLSFCRALGNPDAPAPWPTVCGMPQPFPHWMAASNVCASFQFPQCVFQLQDAVYCLSSPPSHKGKWPRLSFCRALGNPDAPALWPTVCGTPKPFSHWMPTSNVRTSRVTFCCNNYAFYIIFKIH